MHDGTSTSVAISSEEIETELQKILASPAFRRAPRHSRFLTYVVRKKLAGSTDCVKEYLIGLEVFDRPVDYDPGAEPIVRVEAGRLRSRLADYYKTLGRLDEIRIQLPIGTYVPVFSRNGVEPPMEAMVPDAPWGQSISGEEAALRNHNEDWRRWPIAAVVIFVVAITASYFVSRRPAKFTDKDTVVLADFANRTGDPVFDDTLKTALNSCFEPVAIPECAF